MTAAETFSPRCGGRALPLGFNPSVIPEGTSRTGKIYWEVPEQVRLTGTDYRVGGAAPDALQLVAYNLVQVPVEVPKATLAAAAAGDPEALRTRQVAEARVDTTDRISYLPALPEIAGNDDDTDAPVAQTLGYQNLWDTHTGLPAPAPAAPDTEATSPITAPGSDDHSGGPVDHNAEAPRTSIPATELQPARTTQP